MSDLNLVFTLNQTTANFVLGNTVQANFVLEDPLTANLFVEGVYVANGYNNQALGGNRAVQYANGNALAGEQAFVYDSDTNTLTVDNITVANLSANSITTNVVVSNTGNILAINSNVVTANTVEAQQFIGGNANLNTANITNIQANTITANGNVVFQQNANINGNLGVIGLANLSSNSNVKIYGGVPDQVLRTDGNGNLTWSNAAVVGGANTQIQYNFQGVLAGNANLTYDQTTSTLSTQQIVAAANLFSNGNAVINGNLTSSANITYTGANANFGPVGNIRIQGGSNTQVLSTDGFGNLSWRTINTDRISNGNTNVVAQSDRVLMSVNGQANTLTFVSNGTHAVATFQNDVTVTGNLTVQGNAIYANIDVLVVEDPIIEEGGGPNGAPLTTNDGKDRGLLQHYYVTGTGPVDAFIGWNTANSEFAFGSNVLDSNSVITFYEFGNVRGNWWLGNTSGLLSNVGTLTATNANINNVVANTVSANFVSTANASVMDTLNVGNTITAVDVFTSNIQAGAGNIYQLEANVLIATGNVSFTGENVSLGANSNLHIIGGSNGQALITDGNGNLRWGNAGGTPGGANTTIQFNSNGVFAGSANLTFVDDVNGGTLSAVNIDVANTIDVAGIANFYSNINFTGQKIALGSNGNVQLTGGTGGQVLQTDGNGNLSWTTVSTDNISNNAAATNVVVGFNTVSTGVFGQPNAIVTSGNGTFSNTVFANDVVVLGNLIASNLSSVTVNNLSITDPIIDLGGGPNGTPLVAPDMFDRGIVAHTYGNGVSFTSNGVTASGNTIIVVNNIANAVNSAPIIGQLSNGANIFTANTIISNVDVANNEITVNAAVLVEIPNATALYQGVDSLAFMGYDQSNGEFAVGSNVSVAGSVVTYNQLGNLRGAFWLGNVLGNTVTTDGNITTTSNVVANTVVANTANISGNVNAANVLANNIAATGNLSGANLSVSTISAVGNVTLTGARISLGNVANVKITGGANLQFLQTDGTGNLTWADAAIANGIPYIHFDVTSNANNQTFINNNIASYSVANTLSLFRNGGYVEPTDYTIAGNALTVNVKLYNGDNLDIIPTSVGGGGNGGGGSRAIIDYDFTGNGVVEVTDEQITFTFSNDFVPSATGFGATQQTLPVSAKYTQVIYANNQFVAVAHETTTVLTSLDGVNWTERTLPQSAFWDSVAYGNGTYVAAAITPIAARSTDNGVTWANVTIPNSNVFGIAYGNGTFVTVSGGYVGATNEASYSTDNGETWTATTLPLIRRWISVAYGNNTFVAVSRSGDDAAATSPDGITWTTRTMPYFAPWSHVHYANNQFVAVAGAHENSTRAATSSDGINWTGRALPANVSWESVSYGSGVWIAVADNSNIAAYSTDNGVSWSQGTMPTTGWSTIDYGANTFVAMVFNGNTSATIQTDTAYRIGLPAHNQYTASSLTWVVNTDAGNTPTTQASSLGNAITTLRNTYTASYPSAGVVVIDTNSSGNITDTTLTQLVAPTSGNVSLSITQGTGGSLDIITWTDPSTGETYQYSPGGGDSKAITVNEMAYAETLTNYHAYVSAVDRYGNATLTLQALTPGAIPTANIPTCVVTQGSNSTLTVTRSIQSAGS